MSQLGQPHILVLPSGALAEEILTPRAWAVLESLGTVERNRWGVCLPPRSFRRGCPALPPS